MIKLIGSRLLVLPLLLLLLSSLIFALLYLLPGDPARIMAGEYASAETVDRIRVQMGFDRHPVIQYLTYVRDVLQGEWGRSYQSNRLVLEDIKQVFPKTIKITLVAEIMSIILGFHLVCLLRLGGIVGLTDLLWQCQYSVCLCHCFG